MSVVLNVKEAKEQHNATVSKTIFRIAKSNIESDVLRRWWCSHYNLPPTDPRLVAYTLEELAIEYMEYMIDNDLLILGDDGEPVELTEIDGTKVYKTSDPEWSAFEEKWAKGPTFDEINTMMRKQGKADNDLSFDEIDFAAGVDEVTDGRR